MTPTLGWVDGFEFQIFNTTTFNAGGTAMYGAATNASVSTGTVRTGSASLQLDPTGAAAGQITRACAASQRVVVSSFYVRIASSLPAAVLIIARSNGPANAPQIVYSNTNTKFATRFATGSATVFGPTISADTWYRIDWVIDCSGTTFSQTASVDGGTTSNTTLAAQTAADVTSMALGTNGTAGPAVTMFFDDWIYGYTSGDFPYGDHECILSLPTSDGTHVGGTNTMEDNSGTDIVTPGFTTAYTLVNEVPPEATDYIQQSAAGGSNYAEVVFANSSGTVWDATFWGAIEGAGAGSSGVILKCLESNDTELASVGTAAGSVSGTTRRYNSVIITRPSSWTGLKARAGFATDVAPVPRTLSLALQYARATAAPPSGDTTFAGAIPIF